MVVPVGGADKLSTFVSLIGANQLNVAVLMDVSRSEQQRIDNLRKSGYLKKNALVQVGQFLGKDDADTEDLFTPAFYLKLVNGAFATELPKNSRSKTSPTTTRASSVALGRTSRRRTSPAASSTTTGPPRTWFGSRRRFWAHWSRRRSSALQSYLGS